MIFSHIKRDFASSIVVFLVALPLCLGIALVSGVPIVSGLISGIISGIMIGTLSQSSTSVSGPAAGLVVIVLNALDTLGTLEAFMLAVVIAGVLQVILGFAKAGVIGLYFPSAVIKGMLAAIGIIIFLKQIPHAFGYDKDYEGDLNFFQPDGYNTFSELGQMLNFISPGATIVAAISLAVLILLHQHFLKKFKLF